MSGTWASGWIAGDIVTAAEFKKGAGSIADQTLGGSAANIDITGIVGSYAHLLICCYLRGDTAATSVNTALRFNNDSTGSYDYESQTAAAATTASSETFAATSGFLGNAPANTAGANLFSSHTVWIQNYAGTSNNKVYEGMAGLKFGTAGGNVIRYSIAGFWRNSAAITRVTILPTTGNLVAGSRVTIYALGA